MALRTTDAAVKGIIEVDALISTVPFIEVANDLVTELCTSSSYTSTKLELIERWLSAHFYAIRDQRVDTEKAGSVSQKFQYKVDLNMFQTIYGQQAMLIDTAGNLAALNKRVTSGKKRTISITWLGTGDSDGDDIST